METRLTLEQLNAVTEIEIVYKSNSGIKVTDRPQITKSGDTYELLLHYWNKDRIELVEEFKVMYLNRANRVLHIMNISTGNYHSTVVDVRLILLPAIKLPTNAIILAHNHPSGNLRPSANDITLTENIKQCAKMFSIHVIDHLIISSEGYCSFSDEGLL